MDMANPSGMAIALLLALTIVVGGLAVGGPPCSTWVFLARPHTKRSKDNLLGDRNRHDVVEANILTCFLSKLTQILILRRVLFVWEQPGSSLLFKVPWWKVVLESLGVMRVFLWMRAFGHAMMKPTILIGSLPGLSSLKRPMPPRPPAEQQIFWKKSKRWVAGTKHLKSSQVYPDEFCRCVDLLFQQVRQPGAAPGLDVDSERFFDELVPMPMLVPSSSVRCVDLLFQHVDEDDDSEEMGSIDGESDENTSESNFWRDVAQAGKPNGDIRSFMVLKDSDMVLGSQRPIPIQTVACKASKL